MARVAIVTDSTADLSPTLQDRNQITVVPLSVLINDRVFADQIEITTDEFIAILRSGGALPTTSQPGPSLFARAFRDLAATHDGIVVLTISSKLSATYSAACTAAASVTDVIPVEVVDSRTGTMGLGLQVLRAAALAEAGGTAPAIAATLRAETSDYDVAFFVDNLEYLQRGGRIGRAAALIGGLLQLKPILRVDEGQVVPYERTRTRARALAGLLAFAESLPAVSEAAVIHVAEPAAARTLANDLAAALSLPVESILIAQIGPVLCTHIGPGAVGIAVRSAGTRAAGTRAEPSEQTPLGS